MLNRFCHKNSSGFLIISQNILSFGLEFARKFKLYISQPRSYEKLAFWWRNFQQKFKFNEFGNTSFPEAVSCDFILLKMFLN